MKNKSLLDAQRLSPRLPYLIAALFVIQPVMDVISYWFQFFGLSSAPTLLLRFLVLGATVLLGFLLTERRWVYYTAAGVLALIAAGHAWACLQVPEGYQSPLSDLTNYIRVIQMPITVICFITFLQRDERAFEGMQLGLSGSLLVILAVEILCLVTNTDYGTYGDGYGTMGWFSNANSQSNNLCILIPICLAWQLSWKKQRPLLFWTTAALSLTALYIFGTRLAYAGIYAVCVGLSVTIFLIRRTQWKTAVALLAAAVLFTILIPYSPMWQHMIFDGGIQQERQGYINMELGENLDEVKTILKNKDKVDGTGKKKQNAGMTEAQRRKLIADLTPVYRFYVRDFVEIFGAEKTIEMFNYSIDIHDFSAVRAKKLMFAKMLMDDSPVSSKVFGLNLARFTVGENIYDVENDFHGIYYLYGGVGLAAYLAFLAYFVYLIIWALIKNAKRYFTLEAASYGIAFLLCMAHAYNTAGVLRRPNASIYLSAVLAGIYYLVRLRKYDELPQTVEK